jgi:hypothetical protein
VLRRIFGPKRDEVTEERRKLHRGELHNLYFSPDIIRHINSRRMKWAGACGTHGREKCKRFRWESPKERNYSEDRGVDGRMGLEWMLGRLAGRWSGPTWLRIETGGGLL